MVPSGWKFYIVEEVRYFISTQLWIKFKGVFQCCVTRRELYHWGVASLTRFDVFFVCHQKRMVADEAGKGFQQMLDIVTDDWCNISYSKHYVIVNRNKTNTTSSCNKMLLAELQIEHNAWTFHSWINLNTNWVYAGIWRSDACTAGTETYV